MVGRPRPAGSNSWTTECAGRPTDGEQGRPYGSTDPRAKSRPAGTSLGRRRRPRGYLWVGAAAAPAVWAGFGAGPPACLYSVFR